MLIAIVLILTLPRKSVVGCFLASCLCIPVAQVVVLAGVHFPVLRILIIAGLTRCMMEGGVSTRGRFPGGFNRVDQIVVLWTVSQFTVLSLQWMNTQATIHNIGDFIDALGGYLVVRFLIVDSDAVRRAMTALAIICVVQGACMTFEYFAHVNVFGYLGGHTGLTIRDGKIRAEGVMGCLFAGVFGGATVPLFLWLRNESKSRTTAYIGIAGALAMVLTSNSSSSLLALGGSILAIAFWPLRKRMREIRWALSLTLIGLHLVMHGPVWSLIARIDLTGSSSGYHRYYLVDNCIRHFSDWWLLGYKYYNNWGWDMWDLCNQFVVAALGGGLITLVLYIMVFSRSFSAVGTARKRLNGNRREEWFVWCLGADLFANLVAHFGINYMAQMMMTLFPVLAFISVAAFEAKQKTRSEAPMRKQLEATPSEADTVSSWQSA
ncbi:MAG TPA: hypothetical protein VHD85_12615 [Terracidiphilus sp.]|nr:hypothetical protein [Terracidiphilus sp.]